MHTQCHTQPASTFAHTPQTSTEPARKFRAPRRPWKLVTNTPVLVRPVSADLIYGEQPLGVLYNVEVCPSIVESVLYVSFTAIDDQRGILSLGRFLDRCLDVRQTLIDLHTNIRIPVEIAAFLDGVDQVVGLTNRDSAIFHTWLASSCGCPSLAASLHSITRASLPESRVDVEILEDDLLGLTRERPSDTSRTRELFEQVRESSDPSANRTLLDMARFDLFSCVAMFAAVRVRVLCV